MTPEERREYAKKYRAEHRELYREAQRRWVEANPEKARQTTIDYRNRNLVSVRERRAAWMRAHPENRRAAEARRDARRLGVLSIPYTNEALLQKLAYWGAKCWICGSAPYEHWDHVKPLSKGGADILANLRPACGSCNSRKKDRWPYEVAA